MVTENKIWLLVFYHNASLGDYFTEISQVANIDTPQMYSILGNINKSKYLVNGYYEFLYEVPGYEGYNHWKQKIHPFDTNPNSTMESIGYKKISLTWERPIFGGITRSQTNDTFYSCVGYGNYETYWWYSIGAKRAYRKNNTVPSFYETETSAIALWLRIPMTPRTFVKKTNYFPRCFVFVTFFIVFK